MWLMVILLCRVYQSCSEVVDGHRVLATALPRTGWGQVSHEWITRCCHRTQPSHALRPGHHTVSLASKSISLQRGSVGDAPSQRNGWETLTISVCSHALCSVHVVYIRLCLSYDQWYWFTIYVAVSMVYNGLQCVIIIYSVTVSSYCLY